MWFLGHLHVLVQVKDFKSYIVLLTTITIVSLPRDLIAGWVGNLT